LWQPALAPEPLGFLSLDHQVTPKLSSFEPFRQNELANSRLRDTEHPRDLCRGQRIDKPNLQGLIVFGE
jgi:hypothetical protein